MLFLVGCGSLASGTSSDAVTALRVDPAEVELETVTGSPATASFAAIATYGDGSEGPLDLVSWALSNASIGSVTSRGEFTSVDTNGGDAIVTATHLDVEATASLSLRYREDLLEEGLDEGVAAAFEAAEGSEAEGIDILYPLDGTSVPRNLAGLVVAWAGMDEGEVARVRFASSRTDVSVYTTANIWEVPTELWQTITATNSGGTVDLQVTVGSVVGDSVSGARASAPINVGVNRLDTTGSVVYWSSKDETIMRAVAGESQATRLFPSEEISGCYGCHVIAEKLQWMVVTEQGGDGQYAVLDVSDPDAVETVYWLNPSRRATFKAISPDGQWMLGVANGNVSLFDLPNNMLVSTPTLDGAKYNHPSWSPAGDEVALVRVRNPADFAADMDFRNGEIVRVPWDGTTLGAPEIIVEAQPGYNLYYPEYSPDGEWVVFNRSTGNSASNIDAELFVVPAAGGTPIRLDAANGTGELGNSWARWAPLPDDDVLWLGFSSRRGYEVAGTTEPQIWVTRVDPAAAREGRDPSTTPYWLPGQDPDTNNHVPIWWSR
ncbi:MAG: hypothetical protein FJ090_17645 [Deltaproteobacteria bacterium]|nr:hypothetical protein [Deltaproteobacteria bacterium]